MTVPALKERAGVVAALADGTQTVLVRGPDREPSRDSGSFLLYPAYAHQRPERYSDDHLQFYEATQSKPHDGIPIGARAEVVTEYRIPASALDTLATHYVYTADGLREKYGIDTEARVLLLRVSALPEPVTIEERPAYRGCRRWITVDDDRLGGTTGTPVLDDESFEARRGAIEAALPTGHTV